MRECALKGRQIQMLAGGGGGATHLEHPSPIQIYLAGGGVIYQGHLSRLLLEDHI